MCRSDVCDEFFGRCWVGCEDVDCGEVDEVVAGEGVRTQAGGYKVEVSEDQEDFGGKGWAIWEVSRYHSEVGHGGLTVWSGE